MSFTELKTKIVYEKTFTITSLSSQNSLSQNSFSSQKQSQFSRLTKKSVENTMCLADNIF